MTTQTKMPVEKTLQHVKSDASLRRWAIARDGIRQPAPDSQFALIYDA